MSQFEFNDKCLPSLVCSDYMDKVNRVGVFDLAEEEQRLLLDFFKHCPKPRNQDKLDLDNIFSVRAKEFGIFDRVYEPTVYGDNDQLIAMFGTNELLVEQTSDGFACGNLVGYLAISTKSINISVEIDGQSVDKELWPAAIEFVADENGHLSENSYKIRLALDAAKALTPVQTRQLIRKGESIAPYLRGIFKGFSGANAGKLSDLERGVYPVVGITPRDTRYGNGWILELEDGRTFWASGGAKKALAAGFKVDPEGMPTLAILGNKRGSGDRTYVDCGLISRKILSQSAAPGNKASQLGGTELFENVDW